MRWAVNSAGYRIWDYLHESDIKRHVFFSKTNDIRNEIRSGFGEKQMLISDEENACVMTAVWNAPLSSCAHSHGQANSCRQG